MCKATSPESQVLAPQLIVGLFYFILVYYCYCSYYYYYYYYCCCLFVFSFSFFFVWIVVLAVVGLLLVCAFRFVLLLSLFWVVFGFVFFLVCLFSFIKEDAVSFQWGRGQSEVIIFCWSVDWLSLFWNCIWVCSVAGKFGCN